jgi:2-haloacid dehalogenase
MLRAVTFDVYTALFDTVGSLSAVLSELFRGRGRSDDPVATARRWRHKHMEYLLVANSLDREPASNRRAIEMAARYALSELEPLPDADELGGLVAAWERLEPWPDAIDILQRVRATPLRLGALSNGDQAMLQTLLSTLPVTFDRVISTEGGRFKPHPSVYRQALELTGNEASALLHVAGSPTDAVGATAAGIRAIWVNRDNDAVIDPRWTPAHTVATLGEAWGIIEGETTRPT